MLFLSDFSVDFISTRFPIGFSSDFPVIRTSSTLFLYSRIIVSVNLGCSFFWFIIQCLSRGVTGSTTWRSWWRKRRSWRRQEGEGTWTCLSPGRRPWPTTSSARRRTFPSLLSQPPPPQAPRTCLLQRRRIRTTTSSASVAGQSSSTPAATSSGRFSTTTTSSAPVSWSRWPSRRSPARPPSAPPPSPPCCPGPRPPSSRPQSRSSPRVERNEIQVEPW